jgi:hypothetical protein
LRSSAFIRGFSLLLVCLRARRAVVVQSSRISLALLASLAVQTKRLSKADGSVT